MVNDIKRGLKLEKKHDFLKARKKIRDKNFSLDFVIFDQNSLRMLLINQIRYALATTKRGSDRNVDRNWSVTLHFFTQAKIFPKFILATAKSKRVDKKKLLLECLYYLLTDELFL